MFKRVVLFCCLMAAVTSISAQNNDWANLKRYAEANAELMEQPNNGRRVVFMGNSITEGWVRIHPQFFTENGSKISIRPSGTEPKIKFYFSMKGKIEGSIEESMKALDKKLETAAAQLN